MTKINLEVNWREVPRSEMFDRVITAVDASYTEAQSIGDENWVRVCENVLFPFLENEQEKAAAPVCHFGSKTDKPCTRPATERVNREPDEAPDLCIVHTMAIEVGGIIDDAVHALECLRDRDRELR